MYWLYILKCSDSSLYTGIATDVERRFTEHRAGIGARYTASRKPIRIMYRELCGNRSAAQKREAEVKSWTRARKLALINSGG
ncbi:MAG: GIY-YIG nuclease family protein [Burkholderiales bacterium]|nr:GIY-YIG nuclease family protein [Burkholderiales bacterium]